MTGRCGRALDGPPGRIFCGGYRPSCMESTTCESCGREFGCGAADGRCWCAEVALGPDQRAILREHFERCLCPDCLKVAATPVRR
jgi:Cysteine-rich CWC